MNREKNIRIKKVFAVAVVMILLLFLEGKLTDYLRVSQDIIQEVIYEEGITDYKNYTKEGNRFIPTNDDPRLTISSKVDAQINRIYVKFAEKTQSDIAMQIYLDEGNGFDEENSVYAQAEAGCKEIEVFIPAGNYSSLRLDIEESFVFQSVELSLVKYRNNAFKNMIFWGCAIFIDLVLIFAINKKWHMFDVISLREQFAYRKFRISLWGILFVAGAIFINSLYLGESQYYSKKNSDGNLLFDNVKGYGESGTYLYYLGGKSHSVELDCPHNSRGMVLYFVYQAKEDIAVEYTQLDKNGKKIADRQETVWKKGTKTVKFDGIGESCAKIRISIPESFQVSTVYYKISQDHAFSLKLWLGIIYLLLSYGMSAILLCSVRVAEDAKHLCEKFTFAFGYIKNHINKILKIVTVIAVSLIVPFFVNYVGNNAFGWRVTGKSALFFAGIILLIDMAIFLHVSFRKNIELVGFLCILIVGSLFAFVAPPYLGISWDDETHYSNAVSLSHAMDGQISESDEILLAEFKENAKDKDRYSEESQISYNEFLNQLEDAGFFTEDSNSSFSIRQIVYIPSAIGLIIGRGIGLPFHLTVIMGRWMNVWLLAILAYFAMKRLKSGKIVVLLVALIPTNIFIAGNYTYDTWIIAWTILGLSAFFGEWQRPDEKITNKSKWMIILPLLIAVIAKESYFIITLIALFMPDSKFGSRREAWIYRGFIVGAMLIPFILLYFGRMGGGNVAAITDSRGGDDVSSSSQVDFILQYPRDACKVLFEYLKDYLNPFKESTDYLSNMAYFGVLGVPNNLVLGTLVLGALFSREMKEPGNFPWWFRIGIILEYIGIGTMSAVAMYIVYTAVGANTVEGCQGRYLLPVIFPTIYALSRFSGKTIVKNVLREENLNIILLAIMIFCSLQGLWENCLKLF